MIGMLAKVLEISLEAAKDWYLFLFMKLVSMAPSPCGVPPSKGTGVHGWCMAGWIMDY